MREKLSFFQEVAIVSSVSILQCCGWVVIL